MSEASGTTSGDVKIEIQRVLMDINNVTLKITRELGIIDEMVRENGSLANSIEEANVFLALVAKKQGIKSIENLLEPNGHEMEDDDLLDPISIDSLTEKMLHFRNSDQN